MHCFAASVFSRCAHSTPLVRTTEDVASVICSAFTVVLARGKGEVHSLLRSVQYLTLGEREGQTSPKVCVHQTNFLFPVLLVGFLVSLTTIQMGSGGRVARATSNNPSFPHPAPGPQRDGVMARLGPTPASTCLGLCPLGSSPQHCTAWSAVQGVEIRTGTGGLQRQWDPCPRPHPNSR